jgi:hypothetical protein
MKRVAFLSVAVFIMAILYSQDHVSDSIGILAGNTPVQGTVAKAKGYLMLGMGINVLGPVKQIADLMEEYRFSNRSYNWFSGDYTDHPHYSGAGASGQVAYFRNITAQSRIGMLVGFSYLSTSMGYNYSDVYLDISLFNVSLAPVYSFTYDYLELQTGFVLMINSAVNTTHESSGGENYTKFSPGLFTGMNLKIWDSKNSFGAFGTNYFFTTRNKVGPFTGDDNAADTIPESRIRFNHLNFVFIVGLYL